MKAVMVMFDTLSRRFLSAYGNEWAKTPNFDRLSEKSVQFQSFYCGSLPCMPARRELHTGKHNFLHRGWGPLEPYDVSAIEQMKKQGVYTHICTDHSHYWEDGGATYLPRYHSWEGFRGQEGDRYIDIADPSALFIPKQLHEPMKKESFLHNWANRSVRGGEEDYSSVQCINAGMKFIEKNHKADSWFLQIECFDPHEPFDVPQRFLDEYADDYGGEYFDWPRYSHVTEHEDQKRHLIKRYAALISMCDCYLGKVLDQFDQYNLWDDTMLIVNTDHGFLMGEHDWWGKNIPPAYQEIAHLPFFLYDPRSKIQGEKRSELCQTIDIAPTLLDFFGIKPCQSVTGHNLRTVIEKEEPVRQAAIFGSFGAPVNVTDGRYVYMRNCATPDNAPLFEYTLMPTRLRGFMSKELMKTTLTDEFSFTNGMPVLKCPSSTRFNSYEIGHQLFDLEADPDQVHPMDDRDVEIRMMEAMIGVMKKEECPREQYERLGILKFKEMKDR